MLRSVRWSCGSCPESRCHMQDGKVPGLTGVADMAVVARSIAEHFNVVEDIVRQQAAIEDLDY